MDSLPLTLSDGRVITQVDEDELSTDLYFQFQRIATKSQNRPEEASRWLVLKLFLIDGQPLTLENLTEKPPIGIGFRAAAVLGKASTDLLRGMPDPKASSESADLLDGD